MAFFYNTTTKEFPIYMGEVQNEYPDWDGDVQNAPGDLVWVNDVIPTYQADKIIVDAEPVQVDGVWTRAFSYRDLTPDEIERRDAPSTAKAKLEALGLTPIEIEVLTRGALS